MVNFIRTSWGNNAPAVSASDVAKVRKETAAHDEGVRQRRYLEAAGGRTVTVRVASPAQRNPYCDDVKYCLNQGVCLHAACRATDLHR